MKFGMDSMIGQEAADLTKSFHEKVGISGAILTKLDGDSEEAPLYL